MRDGSPTVGTELAGAAAAGADTLVHSLERHVRERPQAPALVVAGHRLTYAQLHTAAIRLAAALRTRGVGAGDRVAHLGRESVHYYEAVFACALLGAVLVPVNHRLTAREVRHIVEDSGSRLCLMDGEHALVADLGERAVLLEADAFEAFLGSGDPGVPFETPVGPDTAVLQLYTSGTTGLPKGVVLAHRSFFPVLRSLRENDLDWITVEPDDRCLVGMPGFHIGGIWFAAQAFNAGACVVGLSAFDAETVRRLVREGEVTNAILVPAMIAALVELPGVQPDDYTALRQVVYGGAPITQTLLERGIAILSCSFAQIYGLTETGNTAVCLPPSEHVPGSPRLRAAGRAYPCVQLRITDEQGTPLAPGEVGEVWLRTPAAMLEYWNQPEATSRTLVDGWIRTGDAALLDQDGYLYLKDRLNDMIIVGGENVYPAEVENALAAHPAVADVAVVGVPDPATGESVLAYVQLHDGAAASTRDLLLHVRGRIAAFKIPRRIEFCEQVPRNPSGKILRRQLREAHWAGHDRRIH